jgi:hypothetical protein
MRPGQIRKEAATAGTLCAGVWLVGLPPLSELAPVRILGVIFAQQLLLQNIATHFACSSRFAHSHLNLSIPD